LLGGRLEPAVNHWRPLGLGYQGRRLTGETGQEANQRDKSAHGRRRH
jgi:hypothetical protein